ncbi:MAG: hypothetical protein R2825_27725 [Saprospiraceae bacterium]
MYRSAAPSNNVQGFLSKKYRLQIPMVDFFDQLGSVARQMVAGALLFDEE